jgi:hypothetical protein
MKYAKYCYKKSKVFLDKFFVYPFETQKLPRALCEDIFKSSLNISPRTSVQISALAGHALCAIEEGRYMH